MGSFRVIVAPIAKHVEDTWEVPIYIERGIGHKELFATAYGITKDMANLRATLVVDAINKGIGK